MKIARRAVQRDFGVRNVELKNLKAAWDPKAGQIVLSARRVRDFTTATDHDYEVFLSLEEVSGVLSALASAPPASAGTLATGLGGSLKPLVRLVSVCAGELGSDL